MTDAQYIILLTNQLAILKAQAYILITDGSTVDQRLEASADIDNQILVTQTELNSL